MPRLRLARTLLVALLMVILQVPLSAFALPTSGTTSAAADVTGPEFTSLRVNGAAIPEDGILSFSHTAWQRAGKYLRITGYVRDNSGLKSSTVALTSPENVEFTPVRLPVGYRGSFLSLQKLPAAGTWTVTLTSRDRRENVSTVSFTVDVLPDTEAPTLMLSTFNNKTVPEDGAVTLLPSVWAAKKNPELRGRVTDLSGIEKLTITANGPDAVGEPVTIPVNSTAGYFTYKTNLTAAGVWSFELEALDKAGNSTTRTLTVSIEEDEAGPVFSSLKLNKELIPDTNIVSVSSTAWQQAARRVQLSGTVTDAGAGLKVAMLTLTAPDNKSGDPIALKVNTTGGIYASLLLPTAGLWTVTLDAEDKLGNPTTQLLAIDVLPDTEGPVLKLNKLNGAAIPAELAVNLTAGVWMADKTPTLEGRVTDIAGIKKLTVAVTPPGTDATTTTTDVSVYSTGDFKYDLNLTKVGTWRYVWTATDKLDNITTTALDVTVQDDTTGPVLGLRVDGADVAANATVTLSNAKWVAQSKYVYVSGSVSDAGAGAQQAVDYVLTPPSGTATAPVSLTLGNGRFGQYVKLSATGLWKFDFTAKDKLGNTATTTIYIDVLP